uniref:apoptotic protease-activating factor 1 isoform X2 n=1 Tax=Myxine glutinosa TaxID=7769 RepID=UPI00358F2474
MDEVVRSSVLQNKQSFLRDLNPSYIIDHLVTDGILNAQEEEDICSQTRNEKVKKLLDVLLGKDNHAVIRFRRALEMEGSDHLAELLKIRSPGSSSDDCEGRSVDAVLWEGGVPPRPVVFVSRHEAEKGLRSQLRRLQNKPGWVVLHGMAGCGKSVLAAEAIRDGPLLGDCFPGGVCWLHVGDTHGPGLLMKLQSLCSRLDKAGSSGFPPPQNTLEAKDKLRHLLLKMYPRSLLVLDDVWSTHVIEVFDVQGRIMVTTRDSRVADYAHGNIYKTEVENEMKEHQCLQILSGWIHLPTCELPVEAQLIIKETKGSPLAVSLIGAQLKDFPNRWQYYLKQLQQRKFQRIKRRSSYGYEALDEAIAISVRRLSDDDQKYYKYLAVFKKETDILSSVLSMLWDEDIEDVEDIMHVFVTKSMVRHHYDGQHIMYRLHDLQHAVLYDMYTKEMPALHEELLCKYRQRCADDFTQLPNDGYIYHYLCYHLVQAGQLENLRRLMFSLDWINSKLRMVGVQHFVGELLQFKNDLCSSGESAADTWQDFIDFLSPNGHLLVAREMPDVWQLALSEPVSSEVYAQGLRKVQEQGDGRVYVKWLNKASAPKLFWKTFRVHTGAVYGACFSPSGELVASCGGDRYLKVWKAETGEEHLSVKVHLDLVLSCSFSADGKQIATCSADGTVKVWNSEDGGLTIEYEGHDEDVLHCRFSHDVRKPILASCSKGWDIKLWDLQSKQARTTLLGHVGAVRSSCFSPDDKNLASCSLDGTLKIWNITSGNEEESVDVSDFIKEVPSVLKTDLKGCAWSPDGNRIAVVALNFIVVLLAPTYTFEKLLKTSPESSILSVDFSCDSRLCALGLSSSNVQIWDIGNEELKLDGKGHLAWVHCVTFAPNGTHLLSASDDQIIRLWNLDSENVSGHGHLKKCIDVAFPSEDAMLIAAANEDDGLLVLSGETGDRLCRAASRKHNVVCCCLNSEGVLIAAGYEDGDITVCDVHTGDVLRELHGHQKCVRKCYFFREHPFLLSCSDDGSLRVWEWKTGDCLMVMNHSDEEVRGFSLVDEEVILSISWDGSIKMWNLFDGSLIRTFQHQESGSSILSCDVCPGRKLFASTSADKTAMVWSLRQQQTPLIFRGHADCVRSCRFSPDGCLLATGADDGTIKIWHMDDNRSRSLDVKGRHDGWINDLHFLSPKLLVSAGDSLKFWDVSTGDLLQTFHTRGNDLVSLHVSLQRQMLVTVDSLGLLYILQVMH